MGNAVLDSARDAVVVIDDGGLIVEFNSAAERIFGFIRSDVLGRTVGDVLVPGAQRAAHETGLRRAAAGGSPQIIGRPVRVSAQRSDGREIIVELFVTRTHDAPPRFTAWIRELSGAEAERIDYDDDRWATIEPEDDPAPVGSWVWVPSKDSLRWSDNLYRIIGLRPGDIAPDPQVIVDLSHPDDRERLRGRMYDRTVVGDVSPTTYRIVRPDGQVRHLRSVVTVTERHKGAPYQIVGFLEDMTERIRARRAAAAHRAATHALMAWTSFEQGAQGLLAGLASALGCQDAIAWVPHGNMLVARTVWRDLTADAAPADPVERGARLGRDSGPAGRAWTRAEVVPTSLAVAIPALFEDDVLALVELRARECLELSERVLRALTEIGREVGAFLHERGDQFGGPVLTPRELEVLALAARGLPSKEIAEQLEITNATVRTHFENLYPKLGASDRAAAVATAIRLGLIG